MLSDQAIQRRHSEKTSRSAAHESEMDEWGPSPFQRACQIWLAPSDDRTANELRQLPHDAREKVWADLSGNERTSSFKKAATEKPVEIRAALKVMEEEIERTASEKKAAFLLARKRSPENVGEDSFRIMFLRACHYDGRKAGKLLIDHLERKRLLFGDASLGRELNLHVDMSDPEVEFLSSGALELLAEHDSTGRAVLHSDFSKVKLQEKDSLSRVLFYKLMQALKNDTRIQMNGIVSVLNLFYASYDYCGGYDYEPDRMAYDTIAAIPVRIVARYIVHESDAWDHVVDVLAHVPSLHIRTRTRTIKGSKEELIFSLKAIGVHAATCLTRPSKKDVNKNCSDEIGTENQAICQSRKHQLSGPSSLQGPKRRRVSMSPY